MLPSLDYGQTDALPVPILGDGKGTGVGGAFDKAAQVPGTITEPWSGILFLNWQKSFQMASALLSPGPTSVCACWVDPGQVICPVRSQCPHL